MTNIIAHQAPRDRHDNERLIYTYSTIRMQNPKLNVIFFSCVIQLPAMQRKNSIFWNTCAQITPPELFSKNGQHRSPTPLNDMLTEAFQQNTTMQSARQLASCNTMPNPNVDSVVPPGQTC